MTHGGDRKHFKTYTDTQRRDAIAAMLGGTDYKVVAQDLDIHEGTLCCWWTEAKRGKGPCAALYRALGGRVTLDMRRPQLKTLLLRIVATEVKRLRDTGEEALREKLAVVFFDIHSADDDVCSLTRAHADALRKLLADRVMNSIDTGEEAHLGRLSMAVVMLSA